MKRAAARRHRATELTQAVFRQGRPWKSVNAGQTLIFPFGNHFQDAEAGTPKPRLAATCARFWEVINRNAYALNEFAQPDLKEVWEPIHQRCWIWLCVT